ncbi:MAG: PKD domain-containing protein [Bacteroidetes bacterium]|nr:PKD domain-containing protein [Bacteroidota bacterium]
MKKVITLLFAILISQLLFAQADLKVVPGSLSINPSNPHIGERITITMSVQNIGNTASSICGTRIFYSTTTNYNDAIYFADISLESIPAGATSSNIQFVHPIPYTFTSGPYYFFIELNHLGSCVESDYFNNEAVSNAIQVNLAAWAEQNIPYPIIFIHGYMSDNTTWDNLKDSLQDFYGWSYGGKMDFCLNYDGNLSTSEINSDYHDFTDESSNHIINPNCDFYTINFAVNPSGTGPYNNSYESNQAAIAKQGRAVQDAISHVLQKTGRDKVILVCHSMGGLAAREYLQNSNLFQASDGKKHVVKLCSIGTPHGGTNISFIDIPNIFGVGYDLGSEAIRDLRTSYYYSINNGAFLFGGFEDQAFMNDQLFNNFVNVDVNCNDTIGELITGINNKSIPNDISYSCLIGTGDPTPINGDGVVSENSANITNQLPINAEIFMLPEPRNSWPPWDPWHIELTKQFAQIIQGIDEPNDNANNHAYKINSGQLNYGIISYQSVSSSLKDIDNYKINVPSHGNLNIQLFNIPLTQFYVNVFNSSLLSVYSTSSNGKSFVNVNTPALSADNYFIVLSAFPTNNSRYFPYGFKVTYTPALTSFCSGTTVLNSSSGSFNDGSGNNDYSSNSDCKWKIQPSGATSITLSFTEFDLGNSGDTIKIYKGGTTSSPLVASYSGNTLPSSINITGGTVLVRFITNGITNAAGWTANYTATIAASYCNGITNLSASSGSFSDGSGNLNYGNNANCSWLINPVGAYAITLNFSAFNTQPNKDFVNIYDGIDNNAALIGSFSGTTIPPFLTSTGGAMLIEFISDTSINAAGWSVNYTSYIPTINIIQPIVAYEYWFDSDYASKVYSTIIPKINYNFSPTVNSGSLSGGVHSLNIRFKDASEKWSVVQTQTFVQHPTPPASNIRKISYYEYWLDDDVANKIQNTISPIALLNINSPLGLPTASNGIHTLHFRTKDDAGYFSEVFSQSFMAYPQVPSSDTIQLTTYEYWFDNDYGALQSNSFANSSAINLISNFNSSGLNMGVHTLNYRFKQSNGLYSIVASAPFVKLGNDIDIPNTLTEYEYWFDSDYANAQLNSISGQTDLILMSSLNSSGLTMGIHTVNLRFKESSDLYSSVISASFIKVGNNFITPNQIVEYRYWFDSNTNAMISIPVAPSTQLLNLTANLNTSNLSFGVHKIHVQFKDIGELWSVVLTDTINKVASPIAGFSVNDSSVCINNSIQFTNLSQNATSYLWNFGDGSATSTAINPVHAYTTSGTFTVTLIATGNNLSDTKTETDYIIVAANLTPIINTSLNDTACAGQSNTLSSNYNGIGYSYVWNKNGITIANETNPTYNATTNGNYTVSVTNVQGCTGVSTALSLVFSLNQTPSVGLIASNTNICAGTSVQFTASSFNAGNNPIYQWYLNNAPVSTNTSTYNLANPSNNDYVKVVVTSSAFCSSTPAATSNSIPLTVHAIPIASISPNGSLSTCEGSPLVLSANTGDTYLWSNGATTQTINITQSGNYHVTITNAGICSATSANTNVTLTPSVTPAVSVIASNTNICQGASVNFTAIATDSGNAPIFQWYLNNSPIGSNSSNLTLSNLANNDQVNIVLTSNAICANSTTANSNIITINVNSFPVATISPNGSVSFCQGSQSTLTASSGSGYLWSNGLTGQSINVNQSGDYSVIVTNPGGCIGNATSNTVHVTLQQPSFSFLNQIACSSFSLNGQNYFTSGTYFQNLTNALGCDSTITLNLTINEPSISSISPIVCDTFKLNGIIYTMAGNFSQNLTNTSGCDSTININLTILANSNSISPTVCNSYLLNGNSYNASGIYTQTLTNAAGCDSTLTINLTVNSPSSSQINITSCERYTLNGIIYYTSGNFMQSLINSNGCDSTINLNLTIDTLNLTINQIGSTLSSLQAGAIYQWLDCNSSFMPIAGSTNQSFSSTAAGNYSVIITKGGCSDTSGCYLITGMIPKTNDNIVIQLFPNPVTNKLNILVSNIENTSIKLSLKNLVGQELFKEEQAADKGNLQSQIEMANYSAGIYFLTIESDSFLRVYKVEKN